MSNTERKTIVGQLQEYLEAGNRIDTHKFADMFQSLSLPMHIKALEKKGLEIKRAKKDGTVFVEYWIEK